MPDISRGGARVRGSRRSSDGARLFAFGFLFRVDTTCPRILYPAAERRASSSCSYTTPRRALPSGNTALIPFVRLQGKTSTTSALQPVERERSITSQPSDQAPSDVRSPADEVCSRSILQSAPGQPTAAVDEHQDSKQVSFGAHLSHPPAFPPHIATRRTAHAVS